ncbi:MAG TPA: c-type cytochrome [Blastocatellia bacterium]
MFKRIRGITVILGFFAVAIACYAGASAGQQSKKDSASTEAGKLFLRECKDCHGEDGRGRMLNQPDFTNPAWHKTVTDDHLFKTIKFGREPMPFYAGALTDDQMRALVGFIRSLAGSSDNKPADRAEQSRQVTTESPARANNCAACHKQRNDESVQLFSKSTHAKAMTGCDGCHGGEPAASTKQAAHANNFVGKPTPNETLGMCGSCHTPQLAAFKTSAHFPERRGTPRMDCAQCHGAHTVGSPARNFSFALFCTGCHGLEYLPELPREFQKMLALVDEQKDSLASLDASGRKASGEILKRRREIRRAVGEIVHSTDVKGGLDKHAQIMKLGDEFRSIIEREKR